MNEATITDTIEKYVQQFASNAVAAAGGSSGGPSSSRPDQPSVSECFKVAQQRLTREVVADVDGNWRSLLIENDAGAVSRFWRMPSQQLRWTAIGGLLRKSPMSAGTEVRVNRPSIALTMMTRKGRTI